MRYSKEWEATVKRMGRWIDFERDYKVYKIKDIQFIEFNNKKSFYKYAFFYFFNIFK